MSWFTLNLLIPAFQFVYGIAVRYVSAPLYRGPRNSYRESQILHVSYRLCFFLLGVTPHAGPPGVGVSPINIAFSTNSCLRNRQLKNNYDCYTAWYVDNEADPVHGLPVSHSVNNQVLYSLDVNIVFILQSEVKFSMLLKNKIASNK